MAQKQPNITINWKGKQGKGGLTETALDLLRKMMEPANSKKYQKFTDLNTKFEEIKSDYSDLMNGKFFNTENEIKMLSKYVRVLV
jgi:hypothetical protein